MQEGDKRFHELLDRLRVESGDVIYLHTSFKRLAYLKLTGPQFLAALVERLGSKGTLALPSFAWNLDKSERPWKGYRDYFETRPRFDVVKTPANIGWIPELFRSLPGVRRSLNYWWPICAAGRFATELTTGQEKVIHPYGPGSSFDMLREYGVKILGLGVSLNTTSLALIPDYALGARHSQQVFTETPQTGVVIDERGGEIETRSFWLLPDIVRLIKPGILIEQSAKLREAILRADEGETINFSYPYGVYHHEALRLGEEACTHHEAVPWLRDYPLKREAVGLEAQGEH